MADFEQAKRTLESQIQAAWDNEDAQNLAQDLEQQFGQSTRDAFENCIEDTPPEQAFDCLEDAAEEANLSGDFRSAWDGAPPSLLSSLRNAARSAIGREEADAIKDVFDQQDISELNRMCGTDVQEVVSTLNLDTTPQSYAECLDQVADAKDLSEKLNDRTGLWAS